MNPYFLVLLRIALTPFLGDLASNISDLNSIDPSSVSVEEVLEPISFKDLPTDVLKEIVTFSPGSIGALIATNSQLGQELIEDGIYHLALAENYQIPKLASIPYHNDLHVLDGVIFPPNGMPLNISL